MSISIYMWMQSGLGKFGQTDLILFEFAKMFRKNR